MNQFIAMQVKLVIKTDFCSPFTDHRVNLMLPVVRSTI